MHPTAVFACLVDGTLEARTLYDSLPVLWKWLGHRIMDDAHLVAQCVPQRGAPLANGEVRVVHVRQAHGIRAKIHVQERLLCIERVEARVGDACAHALERGVARVEHEHARVEVELEARVAVHVRHGGEREGEVEELVKVAPHERVRVEVDDALDAQHGVQRPEVQLGVLVEKAVADSRTVVRWRDQLNLERLPSRRAQDAERAGGEAARDVEEDAPGRGARFLEGVPECGGRDGEQVVVDRSHDCARVRIGCIRDGCPRGELRFSVAQKVSSVRVGSGWKIAGRTRQWPVKSTKEGQLTAFESHRGELGSEGDTTCTEG